MNINFERKEDCWYKDVCNLNCTGCIRYTEMKYLMDSSGIPKARQYPVLLYPMNEHDKEEFLKLKNIKDNITQFIKEGKNLYICSENTGTAKTTWATKIMTKYFDDIWSGNGLEIRGIFIHVQTLLNQLKDFNNPPSYEYLENIKNCDLVIWDDIASSYKLTQYEHNQLLNFIDYRILNKRSNIYTSNVVDYQVLSEQLGARLASRVYNTSQIVEFISKDCRGASL